MLLEITRTDYLKTGLGAGGTDELQGLVDYTFNRPDGTQLGTQGPPFHTKFFLGFHTSCILSKLLLAPGL